MNDVRKLYRYDDVDQGEVNRVLSALSNLLDRESVPRDLVLAFALLKLAAGIMWRGARLNQPHWEQATREAWLQGTGLTVDPKDLG